VKLLVDALTGCDTTSAIFGIGKKSVLSWLKSSSVELSELAQLKDPDLESAICVWWFCLVWYHPRLCLNGSSQDVLLKCWFTWWNANKGAVFAGSKSYVLQEKLWQSCMTQKQSISLATPIWISYVSDLLPAKTAPLFAFHPIPKIAEVVSQPVRAWTAGRISQVMFDRELHKSWTGIYRLPSLMLITEPIKSHNWWPKSKV
jgi:hypothetical protein